MNHVPDMSQIDRIYAWYIVGPDGWYRLEY